jgi:hypothetical protein
VNFYAHVITLIGGKANVTIAFTIFSHFLEDLKCPQNGMAIHNNYPNLYIIIEYVMIKK